MPSQNQIVGGLAAVVVGLATVVVREQTNHPQVGGKAACWSVGPAGGGSRVLQADVELHDRGGPKASSLSFSFNLPDGGTAKAIARRVDARSNVLGGGQNARYALIGVASTSSNPLPTGVSVSFGSPSWLSIGGGTTIKLPDSAPLCGPTNQRLLEWWQPKAL
jgi:hypothetical protein